MRAYEFLTERATSVVYHYTGIRAALKILSSGNFELASVTGNKSEEMYAPKGHPFFLSLTRTPQGDYHRYVGTGGVLFKLNGDWFNQRYIVKPIDYWERSWLHSDGTRSREAEDRVFSREPQIPTTPIEEVHVLLKEQHDYRSPETRRLLLTAKQQEIPVYLYTDERAWRLLDKRRAVAPGAARDVLRGPPQAGYSRKPSDYVKPWIELLTKDQQEHLSDRAQRLLKSIRWYGRPDEDQNLSVDLSNARKPDAGDRESAVWLIKYMQKNNFKSTVDLKNYISDRWDEIIDGKQKAAESTNNASVNETFNQPYPVKWEQSMHGDFDALATLDDGTHLIIMFNNEGGGEWQVEFHRNNSQEVTGEGDAQRVFATVLSAIQRFIMKRKPLRLTFSASKKTDMDADDTDVKFNPESRAKLYNKLVQRYANAWGYEEYAEDHGDQVTYKLTRKNTKIDELKIDNKSGLGAVPYNQDIDYFGLRVQMRPSVFLKLALPLEADDEYSFIKNHIEQGGSVGAPFLDVKIPEGWDDGDFSKPAKIVGHEGRHRLKAALELEGDAPVEVHLFPKGGYRRRDMSDQFIKHMNKQLIGQSGNQLQGPFFTI